MSLESRSPSVRNADRHRSEYAVTVAIRDQSGKIIAEIVQNNWKLRPSLLWDRNYNASAIEVRGEDGAVVLQIRVLSDRIQLQGIWHTHTGKFFEIVKSPDSTRPMGIIIWDPKKRVTIKAIFRYPSDQYLGEVVGN